MGKRIIAQRRGKGSTPYKSPGHRFIGSVRHKSYSKDASQGIIRDILNCPGHSAPLMVVEYDDGELNLSVAPEGIRVNQIVEAHSTEVNVGNTLRLGDAPEGSLICNIEGVPGDGGKFVRSGGLFARIVAQHEGKTAVLLPSKKQKLFHTDCRAMIGVIAGGGRLEKAFAKAGKKYHKMKARNKLYPHVSGQSMNAVDHPHGGGSSHSKSRPDIARQHAPPGAKVGKIRPRRTGRRTGRV